MKYTIDCTNKRLGRVASDIALILQGKKNPSYEPRLAGDDEVEVTNVNALEVTGNKETQKMYYSHNTRIGHLKERSFSHMVEKHGKEWVLRKAVERMLPKNRLQSPRLKRLHIVKEQS